MTTPALTDTTMVPMRELPWAVFDTETTGLDPASGARMLEIAIVRIEPVTLEVVDRFTTLVNPGVPIPPETTAIHRITQAEIDLAPSFAAVAPAISARLQGCLIVGHNVAFDLKFLSAEYHHAGLEMPGLAGGGRLPYACTLEGARMNLGIPKHRLGLCCEHLGITLEGWHAALADTLATAELAKRLLELAEAKDPGRKGRVQARPEWYNSVIPVAELPTGPVVSRVG